MGSMTFKEAYERTGRIFNVSGESLRRAGGDSRQFLPGGARSDPAFGYSQSSLTTRTRRRNC